MSSQPFGSSESLSPHGFPTFGLSTLPQLLTRGANGFLPTEGYHIYFELRLTKKGEVAETEAQAVKYTRAIEELVNHGVTAASLFKVVLLEAQGQVLHFLKQGELNAETLIESIQFAYLFTNTVYEELRDDLGDDWQGFASCLDHGPAIIVAHQSFASSSAVSLGPAANRPAKRLLSGATPAGHLDVPGAWAQLLKEQCYNAWLSINLRDRSTIPFSSRVENVELQREFRSAIRAYRNDSHRQRIEHIGLLDARALVGEQGYTFSAPVRLRASGTRCDLDGFSAMVSAAFNSGKDAVHRIAQAFAAILDFGDHMQRTTPGSILLPWAGDCATTVLAESESRGSGPSLAAWLDYAMRWQNFGKGTSAALSESWDRFLMNVSWAIGGVHGRTGFTIVAPINAHGRQFLIGAGWPVAVSLDAQNNGVGGDIVTERYDYEKLDPVTQKTFTRIAGTEFWKTRKLTPGKLREAAAEAARSAAPNPSDYLAKAATISIPTPRPHLR